MKVLMTCFKPFNHQQMNYSYEVLKYIDNVDKVVLDVVYNECYNQLKNNYNLDEYDIIIALGEARSRTVLSIEKQAVNISSCSLPDNLGNIKKDELIINGGNDILKTKLDYNKLAIYASISDDAGKFVCNNLYYHLLNEYEEKSLFIHIPNCNDDELKYKEFANQIVQILEILKNN